MKYRSLLQRGLKQPHPKNLTLHYDPTNNRPFLYDKSTGHKEWVSKERGRSNKYSPTEEQQEIEKQRESLYKEIDSLKGVVETIESTQSKQSIKIPDQIIQSLDFITELISIKLPMKLDSHGNVDEENEWAGFVEKSHTGGFKPANNKVILDLFKNKYEETTVYNSNGESLLYVAYKVGNVALQDFLIEKCSVDPNLENEDRSTILHGMALCKEGNLQTRLFRIIAVAQAYYISSPKVNNKGFTWLDYLLMTHPYDLKEETVKKLCRC